MKIATVNGMQTIRERAYPLAGADARKTWENGSSLIQLAASPQSPQNFATFTTIYRSNPWVFAAVQAISWALSRLPLKLYQRQADGTVIPISAPLPGSTGAPTLAQRLAQLLEMPAPGVSRQEWIRRIAIDKGVYGNSMTVVEGTGTVPDALWTTSWQRIEVEQGDLIPILKYTYRGTKTVREFTPDQVVHFGRSGDLEGPLGLSPIQPLKYTVALHDALARHLNYYFKNAARPSGMLKVQPGTPEPKIQLIQKAVEELYSAPENAGRILVTSAEWQSLAADPQQSSVVELAKLSREEIAAAFQVPPPIIGILERAVKANVVELRSQFLRDVVGPHAAGIEGDLNAQLIWNRPALRAQGLFVAFDMAHALRPDLTELATVYEKLRHVLTPAEMREFIGYPALRSADGLVDRYMNVPWMPSGQIPLGLPQPQTPGALDSARQEPIAAPAAPLAPEPADGNLQAPYA